MSILAVMRSSFEMGRDKKIGSRCFPNFQRIRYYGIFKEQDLERGARRVALPDAICRKYTNADREWGWQFVFPASSLYFDRSAGIERRHHLDESVIQKAMKVAVREAKIAKPASPHSLRHYVPFLTMSGNAC